MIYSLLCFFSPSPWMFCGEDGKLWTRVQSNVYLGLHIFCEEMCVRPPPPQLPPPCLLRVRTGTGSAPLLGFTFVLEVGVSGVPQSWGEGAGQSGWELNNGWYWNKTEGMEGSHYLGAKYLILYFRAAGYWPCLLFGSMIWTSFVFFTSHLHKINIFTPEVS